MASGQEYQVSWNLRKWAAFHSIEVGMKLILVAGLDARDRLLAPVTFESRGEEQANWYALYCVHWFGLNVAGDPNDVKKVLDTLQLSKRLPALLETFLGELLACSWNLS
jgi:hypothetical protein